MSRRRSVVKLRAVERSVADWSCGRDRETVEKLVRAGEMPERKKFPIPHSRTSETSPLFAHEKTPAFRRGSLRCAYRL